MKITKTKFLTFLFQNSWNCDTLKMCLSALCLPVLPIHRQVHSPFRLAVSSIFAPAQRLSTTLFHDPIQHIQSNLQQLFPDHSFVRSLFVVYENMHCRFFVALSLYHSSALAAAFSIAIIIIIITVFNRYFDCLLSLPP